MVTGGAVKVTGGGVLAAAGRGAGDPSTTVAASVSGCAFSSLIFYHVRYKTPEITYIHNKCEGVSSLHVQGWLDLRNLWNI